MELIQLLMCALLNLTITLSAPIGYVDKNIRMILELEDNMLCEKVLDVQDGECTCNYTLNKI